MGHAARGDLAPKQLHQGRGSPPCCPVLLGCAASLPCLCAYACLPCFTALPCSALVHTQVNSFKLRFAHADSEAQQCLYSELRLPAGARLGAHVLRHGRRWWRRRRRAVTAALTHAGRQQRTQARLRVRRWRLRACSVCLQANTC